MGTNSPRIAKSELNRMQAMLGLRDWCIRLRETDVRSDDLGAVHTVPESREAEITLYTRQIDADPDETMERVLMHELLHCLHCECYRLLPVGVTESPEWHRYEETVVERIRQALERATHA